ncbi:hypothetical protein H5410_014816 [Solanum commersonii]|uniref:Uncharacterized protein n=1 Tax=Solanum commersonii TaxID=4109 RepID=A0A9J5ZS41_SOLCO|nr:hypothetical protein H5410_014816 [Solanum commersonii]
MSPSDPLQHKSLKTINTPGLGRHEVLLERVNPSLIPTHSTRESEWAKAEVVLHVARGCSTETHLKRGPLPWDSTPALGCCHQMHIFSQYLKKSSSFRYLEFEPKHKHYLVRRNKKAEKNEEMKA